MFRNSEILNKSTFISNKLLTALVILLYLIIVDNECISDTLYKMHTIWVMYIQKQVCDFCI